MIRWLEDDRLSAAEKATMARFKATSFAKDLDEGEARWRFMSWPRTDHTPMRFLLSSDRHQRATFTIDAGGHEYGHIEDDEVRPTPRMA
jgi:hypothetical protein